jgi:hypothetical protein
LKSIWSARTIKERNPGGRREIKGHAGRRAKEKRKMEITASEAREARAEAKEKLDELSLKRIEAEKRIQEIEGITRKAGEPQEENPLTKAARNLINGEDISPVNIAPLFEEKADLARKKRILDEAIRLQRQTLEDATRCLSSIVGKARRPEHRENIKNHVRALIAVGKSIEKIMEFQKSFHAEGLSSVHGTGNAIYMPRVGTLADRDSQLNYYIRELVQGGWISKEEVEVMKAEATE